MRLVEERKCPWGVDETQADGSMRHRRMIRPLINGWEEPCSFCGGSNRYADWMKHPEYDRQVKAGLRPDERSATL